MIIFTFLLDKLKPTCYITIVTNKHGDTMHWIDSYEKALIFWLGMVGLAFASIFIGLEISEWFGYYTGLDGGSNGDC